MTRRVAVLGGGLMGSGIAALAAEHGWEVRVFDTRTTPSTTHDRLGAAVENVDWVVEAATESLPVKLELLTAAEAACPRDAVISSTTSTFLPSALEGAVAGTERFLLTHFFRPAELVPLVEVVAVARTDPDVTARVLRWLTELGKEPIRLARETPGMVANRLQAAVLREALHLVDEGVVTVEDVDRIVRASIGPRWAVAGPLLVADLGGLDVFAAVCANLFPFLSDATGVPELLARHVAAGEYGAKTGAGLYRDEEAWRSAAIRIDRAWPAR